MMMQPIDKPPIEGGTRDEGLLIRAILERAALPAEEQQRLTAYLGRLEQLSGAARGSGAAATLADGPWQRLQEPASRFVDQLAHEFRTPLTVIREFASLMHEGLIGEVNQQQRHFLRIVNDRADDLAMIVDIMLDMGRWQCGLLSVWRRRFGMEEVLADVLPALERKAAAREIALATSIPQGLPDVFCDTEKIGRVVVHLTVRAMRHCGEHGLVEIRVSDNSPHAEICVHVSASGSEAAGDVRAGVFSESDFPGQHMRACSDQPDLRLAVARQLVQCHFGRLDLAEGAEGGRSCSFSIPTWDPSALARCCLERIRQTATGEEQVALIAAEMERPVQSAMCQVADEFLQHAFRGNSLVLSGAPGHWAILSSCTEGVLESTLEQVRVSWRQPGWGLPVALLPQLRLRGGQTWPIDTDPARILGAFEDALQLPAAVV